MKNLAELRARRAAITKELRDITEKAAADKRDLTEEEEKRFEELKAERETCGKSIERLELVAEAEREDRSIPASEAPERPDPAASEERSGVEVGKNRETENPFRSFGEYLQAVAGAENAGRRGLRIDPRLYELRAATGMGETVGADGGFAVPKQFQSEILRRMYELGAVLSRCRRIPLSQGNSVTLLAVNETSRATGSRWGGVQGYWVDEGTAATATKPTLKKIELKVNKLGALGYITDELLADASALGTVMSQAFQEELQFLTEDAVVNGTGAGQPEGILNANCLVSVAKETGQAANTLVYENIVKMWSRMYARSRQNAVWFVNQDIEPQLYTLSLAVGTGGAPAYLPANGLSSSPFATLMGRPVVPIEYCATLGTKGDILLADFSQYALIDKGAPDAASSIHVRFTQGEQTFRVFYRVDGQPMWHSALTPFKGSNTQSPFISLDTRS